MSARGDAAGGMLQLWLLLFRVVLGLSCVVDVVSMTGVFGERSAQMAPLIPHTFGWTSMAIELACGLAVFVGVSTRFFAGMLAVQLVIGVAAAWLRDKVPPLEVPNATWLVVLLAIVGAGGAGWLSVDRYRPGLVPRWLNAMLSR